MKSVWLPNPGKAGVAKIAGSSPIFVQWSNGRESGPLSRKSWEMLDWSKGAALVIEAIKVEAKNG